MSGSPLCKITVTLDDGFALDLSASEAKRLRDELTDILGDGTVEDRVRGVYVPSQPHRNNYPPPQFPPLYQAPQIWCESKGSSSPGVSPIS